MSYSANSAYWQAAANRCTGFADEGACLARISRRVPVTIVPGFAGLGQTPGTTTLPAHSAQLVAIQQRLISLGVLSLRTADGVISASSPTLAAIQTWATNNGYSATGVARTSSSGLSIPNTLLDALLAAAPPQMPGATSTTPSVSKTGAAAPQAPSSIPGSPNRTLMVAGGAAIAAIAAILLVASMRR